MGDNMAEQMAEMMNKAITDATKAEAECARLRELCKATADDLFIAQLEVRYLLYRYTGPMDEAAFQSKRFLDFLIENKAPAKAIQHRQGQYHQTFEYAVNTAEERDFEYDYNEMSD
jgi:hypothetical protein